MKYMILLLALCVATTSFADDKPDRRLAEKYLTATDMRGILNASLKQYDEQLSKTLSAEDAANIRKLMAKTMSWDAIKGQLTDVVSKVYSRQELEAYIAFVGTPAGKSYNAKNEEFSRQFSSALADNFQAVLAECCAPKK